MSLLLIAHIGRGEGWAVRGDGGISKANPRRKGFGVWHGPGIHRGAHTRYLGQFRFRLFSSANDYCFTLTRTNKYTLRENGSNKKLLEKIEEKISASHAKKVESVIKASITNITHERKSQDEKERNGSLQLNRNAIPTNIWECVS